MAAGCDTVLPLYEFKSIHNYTESINYVEIVISILPEDLNLTFVNSLLY